MSDTKRKLSSVTWTRNDSYPNMPYRCLMYLQCGVEVFDEIVLVDWCSPNNVPFVEQYNEYIPKTGKIKSIEISEEKAESIFPLYRDFEKSVSTIMNIGICRAEGDFVLSNTVDLITERPNIDDLATDTIYVHGRRGVPEQDYLHFTDSESLKNYLMENYLKYPNAPDSVSPTGEPIWDPIDVWSLVVCVGDFQLAHKNVWNEVRGFEISAAIANDSNLMKKVFTHGLKSSKIDLKAFHLDHIFSHKYISREDYLKQQYENVAIFQKTKNSENWGLQDVDFKIRTI